MPEGDPELVARLHAAAAQMNAQHARHTRSRRRWAPLWLALGGVLAIAVVVYMLFMAGLVSQGGVAREVRGMYWLLIMGAMGAVILLVKGLRDLRST